MMDGNNAHNSASSSSTASSNDEEGWHDDIAAVGQGRTSTAPRPARVRRPRPASRRNQRSCIPCASAKRSCDHGSPCGRCVSLGISAQCTVAADRRVTHGHASLAAALASESTAGADAVRDVAAADARTSDSSSASESVDEHALALTHVVELRKRARRTSTVSVLTSPSMSMGDLIGRRLVEAGRSSCSILVTLPALPMRVPVDVCHRVADASGRFTIENLVGPHSRSALEPIFSVREEDVLAAMSRSSAPTLRVRYKPASEFNIRSMACLSPAVCIGNLAWAAYFFLPSFAPGFSSPGQPVTYSALPSVLRLTTALGITVPLCSYDPFPDVDGSVMRDILACSDEELLLLYSSGVVLQTRSEVGQDSPSHVAPEHRTPYFENMARVLANGCTTSVHDTVVRQSAAPPSQGGDATLMRAQRHVGEMMARAAAALADQPGAAELLRSFRFPGPVSLRVKECVHFETTRLGVITALSVSYPDLGADFLHALPSPIATALGAPSPALAAIAIRSDSPFSMCDADL